MKSELILALLMEAMNSQPIEVNPPLILEIPPSPPCQLFSLPGFPSEEVFEEEPVAEKTAVSEFSAEKFRMMGVINWNDYRWTWYSEKVLPGEGLEIPGRHLDENGYVCDENEYICLASSVLSKGTVVETPFGKKGCIYDTGCRVDTLDVYVGW